MTDGAALGRNDVARKDATQLEDRFAQVVRDHGAGLARVVSSYARTAAERDDLWQEISLALWRALPGFRGDCSERTFVYRIAHNQGLSHAWRRRAQGARTEPVDGDSDGELPADEAAPDPEAQVGASERRELLFAAIRTLPLPYRQVLTLALEDLAHDEIADVLGTTANNVTVRLSRARDALRKAMGGA